VIHAFKDTSKIPLILLLVLCAPIIVLVATHLLRVILVRMAFTVWIVLLNVHQIV